MGTVVAALRLDESGPAVLLSGHLEAETPILVYRVADYAAAVDRLRGQGMHDIQELEIAPSAPGIDGVAHRRAPRGRILE